MRQETEDSKVLKRQKSESQKTMKLPSEIAREVGKPTLKDFERYTENPFLTERLHNGLSIRFKKVKENTDEVSFNLQTGEYGESLLVGKTHKVDPEAFVKIYTQDIAKFLGLSKPATNLFFILVSMMQENKNTDHVTMNLYTANAWIEQNNAPIKELSKPSFYRAVAELCANDFIAQHALSREMYWINPSRVFNGNRVILANQYIINQNDKDGVNLSHEASRGALSEKAKAKQVGYREE